MADQEAEVALTLPHKLKFERETQGLALENVAEKLNLSVEQIASLENYSGEIAELSPFERGYIKNYASLLGIDIAPYMKDFPKGATVGSELHSVNRFSYKISKPLASRSWVRTSFGIIIFAILLVVLVNSGFDLDSFTQSNSKTDEASQIMLPNVTPENSASETDSSSQLSLPPLSE